MKMKKIVYLIALVAVSLLSACNKKPIDTNNPTNPDLKELRIQIELPQDLDASLLSNIEVKIISGEMVYLDKSNETGMAVFNVPVGLYSIFASATTSMNNKSIVLNGSKEEVVVDNSWDSEIPVIVKMVSSSLQQVIIKEMYTGGVIDPVTQKNYTKDSYFKLYNNSPIEARIKNFGMAVAPGASNKISATMWETINYKGDQCYANLDWLPLHQSLWYTQDELVIPPYSDVVIAMSGAIDHTLTMPFSIDLSEADYVHYDPEGGMDQGYMYPAPSEKIPTSHYMKCVLWGVGFGWILPIDSPALVIFSTEGITPKAWASSDESNFYPDGLEDDNMFLFKKLKRSWCIDAVEAFDINHVGENIKRLTPDLDGGFVYQTWSKGHSVYRNVDKEATEAIAENEGKLVYGYNFGTDGIEFGSTDPSGIDAEASMKNGAKIVYKDTNNSTNDFHLRLQPSLRD